MQLNLDDLINHWIKTLAHSVEFYGYDEQATQKIQESHLQDQPVSWLKAELIKTDVISPTTQQTKDTIIASNNYNNPAPSTFKHAGEPTSWTKITADKMFHARLPIKNNFSFPRTEVDDLAQVITTGSYYEETKSPAFISHVTIEPGEQYVLRHEVNTTTHQFKLVLSGDILIVFEKKVKMTPDEPKHKYWLYSIADIFVALEMEARKNKSDLLTQLNEFHINYFTKSVEITFAVQLDATVDGVFTKTLQPIVIEKVNKLIAEHHQNYKQACAKNTLKEPMAQWFENGGQLSLIQHEHSMPEKITTADLNFFTPNNNQLCFIGSKGVGKTALVHYLLQQWANNQWLRDHQWVFLIDVNRLTAAHYPEPSTYRLADIIITECISKIDKEFTRKKPAWFLNVYKGFLETQIAAGKVLVILDNVTDKMALPNPLKQAYFELTKATVFFTTRSFNHEAFSKYTWHNHRQHLTVQGFSSDMIVKYIEAFFSKYPPERKAEFLTVLQDKANQDIIELCKTPAMLQSICKTATWINLQDKTYKSRWCENILYDYCRDFLHQYYDIKYPADEDWLTIFTDCKLEIAFLEYFAFIFGHRHQETYDAFEYLKNAEEKNKLNSLPANKKDTSQGKFLIAQKLLGFIKSVQDSYWICHDSYQFKDRLFHNFFKARYIAACLLLPKKSIYFPFQHRWIETDDCKTVDDYIKAKAQDESFAPVWRFVEAILLCYSYENTLTRFHSLLEKTLAEKSQENKYKSQKSSSLPVLFPRVKQDKMTPECPAQQVEKTAAASITNKKT